MHIAEVFVYRVDEFFPSAGEYAHGRATHISSRSQNSESDIFQDENWFKSRDQDNILQSFESVLKAVHKTFFHALDSNSSIRADGDASDVRFILELLRDQVLQDCSIMFSSIIPKEVPWNKSAEVTLARSYGAELYEDFPRFQSEKITHLVCGKKNTDKYHKALQLYPDIKIVKLEWLWGSAFHFKRMEEHLFDLDRKESIPWKICHDPVSTEELFASISHVLQRSDSEYSGYSASFSSDMTAIFRAKRQKTDSSEKNFILEEKSVSTVPAEVSSNDQDGVLEEISNASTSESLSTDEDGFAEAMGADLEAFLDNLP